MPMRMASGSPRLSASAVAQATRMLARVRERSVILLSCTGLYGCTAEADYATLNRSNRSARKSRFGRQSGDRGNTSEAPCTSCRPCRSIGPSCSSRMSRRT